MKRKEKYMFLGQPDRWNFPHLKHGDVLVLSVTREKEWSLFGFKFGRTFLLAQTTEGNFKCPYDSESAFRSNWKLVS